MSETAEPNTSHRTRHNFAHLEDKRNENFAKVHRLMVEVKDCDVKNNPSLFKELHDRYVVCYNDLMHAHEAFCEVLSKKELEEYLENWFMPRDHELRDFQTYLEKLLKTQDEIKPSDSVSQIQTRTTHRSNSSSTLTVLKMKQQQETAELESRKRGLLRKQNLLREELELQLKKEMLAIEIEEDIAQAKTKVLDNTIEQLSKTSKYVTTPLSPNDKQTITHVLDPKAPIFNVSSKTTPSPIIVDTSYSPSNYVDHNLTSALVQNVKRPPIDLKKFGGDPLEFKRFIRQFETKVVVYTTNDDERMNYLEQYTFGQPHNIVSGYSYLDSEAGYKAAMKELAERYGNSDVIANAYCKKALEWKPVGNNSVQLDEYGIFLVECYHAIQSIESLKILEYPDNLRQLVQKLPFHLHDRWRTHVVRKREHSEPINFLLLVNFVKSEAKKCNDPIFGKEALNFHSSQNYNQPSKPKPKLKTSLATQSVDSHRKDPPKKFETCINCSKSHNIINCDSFKTKSHSDKLDILRINGICFGCMKKGHIKTNCTEKLQCLKCIYKHPTILHIDSKNTAKSTEPSKEDTGKETAVKACALTRAGATNTECTMAIVPVKIRSQHGLNYIDTYAFLDPGSSVTFCSDKLIQRLGIQGKKRRITLETMTDRKTVTSSLIEDLQVYEYNLRDSITIATCYTKDKIPVEHRHIPTRYDIVRWSHLNNVEIPEINVENDIDLMIGNNIPDAFTPHEVVTGPKGTPHATRTSIGWILWNVLRESNENPRNVVNRVDVQTIEEFDKLDKMDQLLRKSIQYDFPERQIDDRSEPSFQDQLFLEKVDKSAKYVNGRYEIALPFKDDDITLPNNEDMVMNRLRSLERKLKTNENFRNDYTEFMNSVINEGYAEIVPKNEIDSKNSKKWFVPHHGVYHKQKKKIRTVFDCSARYSGISLNDVLLSGPDLANNLIGVLMRFRMGKIGLLSDIKGMFHQVKIPPEDRDSLRFFWWPEGNLEADITQYRMTSHLFGAVSSPSIANYALQKTALDFSDLFDEDTVNTVLNNFYVDDCLSSTDEEENATKLVTDLVELCRKGGFRLHKWISNSPAVLNTIPDSEKALQKTASLGEDVSIIERALGVNWDVCTDTLTFKINIKDQPYTRRGLLSITSSVFDPLGLASPALLYPKTLLQELCKNGISWDTPLEEPQRQKWCQWLKELPKLENFNLPRCTKPENFQNVVSTQLHIFADASLSGYGICCYLRQVDSTGEIACSLIFGKSRVTPIKRITIPRLELTAATVAVKISKKITYELSCNFDRIMFWTDSTTVLGYIANEATRFKTFVANRISLIREATTLEQWRKVPTEDNPADDASRGLTVEKLIDRTRWFHGPQFLHQTEDFWPTDHTPCCISENDPETKLKTYVTVEVEQNHGVIEKLLNYFSKWEKLRKAVAWLLKIKTLLIAKCQRKLNQEVKADKPRDANLEPEDVEKAELCIIKHEQLKYLNHVREACLEEKKNKNQKKLKELSVSKLDPFIDKNDVLRVGGRLRRSSMELNARHQIILPKDSKLSELIIRHTHISVGHMGKNAVLSELRKKYWILGASKIIKRIISSCVICRRNRAKVNQQKMADLPANRIISSELPFTYTGMDFFGPYEIQIRRSTVKRYGVIFSCFNSRAVHLDIVSTMDTDSCINCIRRFIARRGSPKVIRSDNGSNIVGAVNELNQQKISSALVDKGIKWEFNPPAASNFGGVWERLIRSVRKVLNSLLREQMNRLNDESLITLMCEVEYILNNRPLTKNPDDPNDLDALTPNHLLLVGSRSNSAPVITCKQDLYVRRRWRQVQYLTDIFWKRWSAEYLPTLQERHKWLYPTRNIEVNDIVLIMDSKIRNSWTLARVLKVFPDKNGMVRFAMLKTKLSTLERPVNKLCTLLEAEN